MEQPEFKPSDILAQERTHLAAERTRMAANRTLMAWVRTSIAFIGFGFTIYKFLQSMQEEGKQLTYHPEGPRNIGLILLAMGTASAILGIIEYWNNIRVLRDEYRINPHWFPLIVAFLLALLGIYLISTIILAAVFFSARNYGIGFAVNLKNSVLRPAEVRKNSASSFNDSAYNVSATGLLERITPLVDIRACYRKSRESLQGGASCGNSQH